jgi:hypothetical protein
VPTRRGGLVPVADRFADSKFTYKSCRVQPITRKVTWALFACVERFPQVADDDGREYVTCLSFSQCGPRVGPGTGPNQIGGDG